MELVLCVTWGSGAWSSVVSIMQMFWYPVYSPRYWRNTHFKSFQWTTSAAFHSNCCTVTLRERWTAMPSAGWSSCLSSGTQRYTEMPPGWTGKERQLQAHFGQLWSQSLLMPRICWAVCLVGFSAQNYNKWNARWNFTLSRLLKKCWSSTIEGFLFLQEDKEDYFAQYWTSTSLYKWDIVRRPFLQQSHLLSDHHGHSCPRD